MTEPVPQAWMEIGHIVAPQGLDGSVRVYPSSDFPERFLEPGERWLQKPQQVAPEQVQLISGRYLAGKGLYVLKLEGCSSRDQAEALRNARLMVPEGDRLPIEPGEFHVADLIGLQVRLRETGLPIGTVVDVYAAGNDLLAVQLIPQTGSSAGIDPPGRSAPSKSRKGSQKPPQPVLIPFVYEIVPVVDLEAGFVELTPPPGLLPEPVTGNAG